MQALKFRNAQSTDLPQLVAMLASDTLGAGRERNVHPLPQGYRDAFTAIDTDENNELIVALLGQEIVGMLQLTFIPGLTYEGGWRALVEGVRIAEQHRDKGLGTQLLEWAAERARARSCRLLQLTTDKRRPEAVKFYERLGFTATHEGMKRHLA